MAEADPPTAAPLASTVPASASGQPLVAWLAQRFRYLDAAAWRAAAAAGRLQLDGRPAGPDDRLRGGERLVYAPPPAPPAPLPPLLHVDAALVAVDKPAGAVAHAESAFAGRCFVPALRAHLAGGVPPAPLHLAHRLDRDTSGVLLFARDIAALQAVQAQFAAGAVQKRYLALVHGVVAADQFVCREPIGPAEGSAVAARRAVRPAGGRGVRAAHSEFTVLRRFAAHTLLAAQPRTGRTHQLRVHLAHAGHPLVGDALYGRSDADYLAEVARRKAGAPAPGPRQLLHAAELALAHPTTGAPLRLQAPLPADFAAELAARSG